MQDVQSREGQGQGSIIVFYHAITTPTPSFVKETTTTTTTTTVKETTYNDLAP
jgi:hypothetical protein